MVKTLKIIVKTSLEGCMCERERYQTNSKSETNIHPKIDEKPNKNHALKRGSQKMKTHQKSDQKRI